MYVYLQPQTGFNDMLWLINDALEYCKKYNRILLLDTVNTVYKINFSDYFGFSNDNIICNINKIIEIFNTNPSVYPTSFNNRLLDIISGKLKLKYIYLPDNNVNEKLIIYSKNGCSDGNYKIFKSLIFSADIKRIVKTKYDSLETPYLSIQVRNTDYKCDYKKLYHENKEIIHSYKSIYVATDNIGVLEFFRELNLPVINFVRFPSSISNILDTNVSIDNNIVDLKFNNFANSLHTDTTIDSHTKIIDLICDIYIIAMSDKLLSNSIGGFIQLARNCHNDRFDLTK